MNKIITIILFLLFVGTTNGHAQSYEFSLDQAVSFAKDSSYAALNARRDIAIAIKKKWETTATGLPQINGSINYNNNLKQPVTLIPGEITGGAPGTYTPVVFGTEQNATAQATLDQLIFDGSYLVGLKAAKTFLDFSKNALEKTQTEVEKSVVNAYVSALTMDALVAVFENNQATLEAALNELKIVYANGMAEQEQLEQLEITLLEVDSYRKNASRSQRIARDMLKASLGLALDASLTLTDPLEAIVLSAEAQSQSLPQFELEQYIDYKIAENFTTQRQLEWLLERSRALPSVSAFMNYSTQAFRSDFSFTEASEPWFQSSMLGLRIKLPLFSSGLRGARSLQAKIAYEQAQTDFIQSKQSIIMAFNAAESAYALNQDTFKNAEKSLVLAERIAQKNQIKFNEGLASSFEQHQANAQLYQAQQAYYQSLLALVNAKTLRDTFLSKTLSNKK